MSPARREVVAEAAVVVALALLCIAFCAPSLTQAYVFNDWETQNLPERVYFARGLLGGELRWWAPALGGGFPLFAEGQAAAAYPGNWIFLLCPTPWFALSWNVLFHLIWAALGVYALARLLGQSRAGGLAAAVVYAWSGPVWMRAIHLNFFHGLCWLPWLVWALEFGLRGRRWAWTLAGGCLGLMVLAGHAQPPLLASLLAPVWLLGRGCRRWGGGAAALLLAGLLGAVQVLPQLELAPRSNRTGHLTAPERTQLSLLPEQLYTLAAPTLHGSPYMDDLGLKQHFHTELHWEWCAHVGLAPLFLWLLSPVLGRRRARWLPFGLALGALVLAMGTTFPCYGWLGRLPAWSSIRGPARLLGLFAFGVALVTGFTLNDLAAHGLPRRHRLSVVGVLGLAVVLAVGAAALLVPRPGSPAHAAWLVPGLVRCAVLTVGAAVWILARPVFGTAGAGRWQWAAVMLIVADLASGGFGYHRLAPPAVYDAPPGLAEVRSRDGERILVGLFEPSPLMANRHLLFAGVDNLALYTPLHLKRFAAIWERLADAPRHGDPAAWTWLRVYRARWTNAGWLDRRAPRPGELVRLPVADHAAAWLAATVQSAPSAAAALAAVRQPDWDPDRTAVIEAADAAPASRPAGDGTVTGWRRLSAQRVVVDVHNGDGAVLVLSQTGYPGWRVVRGGRRWAAQAVDYALLGAVLPAGDEPVRWVYDPLTGRLGLFLTLLGLALAAGWLAADQRRGFVYNRSAAADRVAAEGRR